MSHPTERCELTNLCMIPPIPRTVSSCRIVPIPAGRASASPVAMWNPANLSSLRSSARYRRKPALPFRIPFSVASSSSHGRMVPAMVLLFRATRFTGTLTSSSEGKMLWLTREELKGRHLTSDFPEMLCVFENPTLSEFYYYQARPRRMAPLPAVTHRRGALPLLLCRTSVSLRAALPAPVRPACPFIPIQEKSPRPHRPGISLLYALS